MGSGSSRKRQVQTFNKGNQVSGNIPDKSVSRANSPVFVNAAARPAKRQAFTQDDMFQLDPNIEEYSSVWDSDAKLSTSFQPSARSTKPNVEHHHQQEILSNKRTKKTSTNINSTHVESTIDTETHALINLSSTERIDELIHGLNHIHTHSDDVIKHRTNQISSEIESVLGQILNDTQQKQQRLLNYAKEQQSKQDEHYRKLLQDYITQLDQIKAKDLADLQKQLQMYRNQILEESQRKIMIVNQQANSVKTKILHEEQQQAGDRIDSIIGQLQQVPYDDKLQQFGGESITKTNITTNVNFGSKPPGTLDSDVRPPSKNIQGKRVSVVQRQKPTQ